MKWSVRPPFYRPASRVTPIEDGTAVNKGAGIFLVCDGVSGPYCPSKPGIQYAGGKTGGQMVSQIICEQVSSARPETSITKLLLDANQAVYQQHLAVGKDPQKEAVAGASVSACSLINNVVAVVLIGDCFILYKNTGGFRFLTNFDQAAFDFETRGNEAFDTCKNQAGGDIGKAWDLYYPYFCAKQFFRANRNIGSGGHAVLNGNPSLQACWRMELISILGMEWMLLGTDGLLTADSVNPANRAEFTNQLGQMYVAGGLPAILGWRDANDVQPHIGRGSHPESSAIEITFS